MDWEYWFFDVWYGEAEFDTGERGLMGSQKRRKEKWWCVSQSDGPVSEKEILDYMGSHGWELVGAAVSSTYSAGGSIDKWFQPSHRLFFKRPKSEAATLKTGRDEQSNDARITE